MTFQQRPPGEVLPAATTTPPGRGRWTWLRAGRIAWIVLALGLLVIFVANIPYVFQSLNTFCTQASPEECPTGQLTLGNVHALTQLHSR